MFSCWSGVLFYNLDLVYYLVLLFVWLRCFGLLGFVWIVVGLFVVLWAVFGVGLG